MDPFAVPCAQARAAPSSLPGALTDIIVGSALDGTAEWRVSGHVAVPACWRDSHQLLAPFVEGVRTCSCPCLLEGQQAPCWGLLCLSAAISSAVSVLISLLSSPSSQQCGQGSISAQFHLCSVCDLTSQASALDGLLVTACMDKQCCILCGSSEAPSPVEGRGASACGCCLLRADGSY